MPRNRPAYAPEFRQKLIELAGAGRSPEELAKEFEPSAQPIRNWVKRAEADGGHRFHAGGAQAACGQGMKQRASHERFSDAGVGAGHEEPVTVTGDG